MRYALLHNHTRYSIKDSLVHSEEYVEAIYKYNNSQSLHKITTFALTDSCNMYGLVDYHKACTSGDYTDGECTNGDFDNYHKECISEKYTDGDFDNDHKACISEKYIDSECINGDFENDHKACTSEKYIDSEHINSDIVNHNKSCTDEKYADSEYVNNDFDNYNNSCTPSKNIDMKIKPIYGNEINHIDTYIDKSKLKYTEIYSLVILAKNEEGLENLYAISTEAGIHKVKNDDFELFALEENYLYTRGRGIIALSGGIYSKIGRFILNDEYEEAKKLALHFNDIFDEFYLEILPYDNRDFMKVNNALLKMHKEINLPLVITSDTHYIYKEDKEYHDLLKSINNSEASSIDQHMRTPDEIITWCKDNKIPLSAVRNTALIADKCTADITPKDTRELMPSFKCPKGYDEDSYLKKQIFEGFKKKISEKNKAVNKAKNEAVNKTKNKVMNEGINETKNKAINKTINISKYIKRLNYEYSVIKSMGYSSYFLILWDFCVYCENNNILLGPGRGSSVGSLVSYCLNITKIDPVENNLIFERFLNNEREDEPDVDIDVASVDRKEALEYFETRYGMEYVCHIAAFCQYKIKNTIKAVLGTDKKYSVKFKNSITKNIPDLLGGQSVTYDLLEDIKFNKDKYDNLSIREIRKANNIYDDLQKLFNENPKAEKAVKKICGAISNVSTHAGGVLISSKKLRNNMPLMAGENSIVHLISQLDMDGIHYLHGLKVDVLGLKTLSIVKKSMEYCNLGNDWYNDEKTDDKNIYDFLRQGNTKNIFQMSKYTASKMIKDFSVTDLKGLNAVNACNRPGPLSKGIDGMSIANKYINSIREFQNEKLDFITNDTNGQLIYQEQLMMLGMMMAGYSLGNADIRIRKTIAEKDLKKIPEIKNEFVYGRKSIFNKDEGIYIISSEPSNYCKGAINMGFTEEESLNVFKSIECAASYCFNKSHSYAYAFLSYKTAYLSLYHKAEYAAACMNIYSSNGNNDKVFDTLNECRRRGIKIFLPNINEASDNFTVFCDDNNNKSVRFGFLGIKDVGSSISEIIKDLIDTDGTFTSFEDFLKRTLDDRNNSTLRKKLSTSYENITRRLDKNKRIVINVRNPFSKRNVTALIKSGAFDELEYNRDKVFNEFIKFRNKKNELNKELLKEDEYDNDKKLKYELDTLGCYVSGTVLDNEAYPYIDLKMCKNNDEINIYGIVKSFRRSTKLTKTNEKYYKLNLELKDKSTVNINVWNNIYEKFGAVFKEILYNYKISTTVVKIHGKVYKDESFTNINVNNIELISC